MLGRTGSTAWRSASASVMSSAVQPVVMPSACSDSPSAVKPSASGDQRDVVPLPAEPPCHRDAQSGTGAHHQHHGFAHAGHPSCHDGRMSLRAWVLHVDLDQFIAAVEVLRRPELAGLPVVVGGRGDPTERGVVSTASYEARAFGVGSGMPLRTAARKCPDAVFLPVDAPAYDAASARVMDTLRSFGVPVEVLGWDEAFLGVETDDPEAFARGVQAAVLEATRLHCSVGHRRQQAPGQDRHRLRQAARRLPAHRRELVRGDGGPAHRRAVGRRPQDRQALADARHHTVRRARGHRGAGARRPARPDDGAVVPPARPRRRTPRRSTPTPYVARGHGRETTFQENQTDRAAVADAVRELAPRSTPTSRLKAGRPCGSGMKLRYAPFETRTRSLTLPGPTSDVAEITDAALELLGRFDETRAVRLVGVRLEMAPPG